VIARATSVTIRSVHRAPLVLGVLLLAMACGRSGADADGDDPIAALGSRAPTTRYVHDYWLDQARRGTSLWDSAFAICSAYWQQQDGSRPNCGHVRTASFYHAGATTPVRRKNMSVDSLKP
jgi:hypothetical protein